MPFLRRKSHTPASSTVHRRTEPPAAYVQPRDPYVLETASEVEMATFLLPFQLSSPHLVVRKLIESGYTSAGSLHALDDQQVAHMHLDESDGRRVLLAAWLHSVGLVQYGHCLIENSYDSLLALATLTEEQLKAAGIKAMGHRRQLQRYLREDEHVQALVVAARAVDDARKRTKRGLHAGRARPARKGQSPAHSSQIEAEGVLHQDSYMQGVAMAPSLASSSEVLNPCDLWHSPWRTMSNASLGNPPGQITDSYYAARLAKSGEACIRIGDDHVCI